ncbi:MAG: serine hydrolase [Bryobacteraceae bacterium]
MIETDWARNAAMTAAAFLMLAGAAEAQPLGGQLRDRVAGFPGGVSLYAKNLDSGEAIGIRETEPVRTASTIKLAVMAALFDAITRGELQWSERLTITDAEKVAGSGVIESELSSGVQLPLQDVMHLMMALSDNTATNMILERFPADRVNAYLDRIGLGSTRSLRKILGKNGPAGVSAAGKLEKNQKYGLGVSTPRDMVALVERMERGELVSAEASREMIAVMKRCQDTTGIRRPFGELAVANKTGALDALRSDVGIVYSKTGRIAIAITVDGIAQPDWGPDNPGSLLIADLARMLVRGLATRQVVQRQVVQ